MRRSSRIDVDAARLHPVHGPVWCLACDAARRLVVWEAIGEGNGRPEGECGLDEWAGWPLAEGTGETE